MSLGTFCVELSFVVHCLFEFTRLDVIFEVGYGFVYKVQLLILLFNQIKGVLFRFQFNQKVSFCLHHLKN